MPEAISESLLQFAPSTFHGVVRYFANANTALAFVTALRWPNGVRCIHCASRGVTLLTTRPVWKCRSCRRQFSVKSGTIFEDSPLGFDRWLPVLWVVANRRVVSSYQLARLLGVTQKTAWLMLRRVRIAIRTGQFIVQGGNAPRSTSGQHPDRRRATAAAPVASTLLPRGSGVLAEPRARAVRKRMLPHCARNRWKMRKRPRRGSGRGDATTDADRGFWRLRELVGQITAVRKTDTVRNLKQSR